MTERADLRPAMPQDAEAIVALREDCARWQLARGVRQWAPGEVPLDRVRAEVGRGEWFVDHQDGALRAAVRVLDDDPLVWPDRAVAGYLHGLMVARRLSGVGLGATVLAGAERHVAARGRDLVRLDCVATNQVLRTYYQGRGYTEAGVADRSVAGMLPAMRFEKRLEGPAVLDPREG